MNTLFRHSFILLLLMLARLSCAQAQSTSPDEVCVGTTSSYWVDSSEGSLYLWAINGVQQASNASTIEITWNQPGEFVLSVQETNAVGCSGETKTLDVTVIDNLAVLLSIESSASAACEGSEVVFTATALNAGSNPLYTWIVNGLIVPGETNATLNLIITESVVVQAIVTSNLECVLNNPATSNNVEVIMTDELFVDVSIEANEQLICEGSSVTISATTINEGSNPIFTWFVNDNPVSGQTGQTFSFVPAQGDVVYASLLSDEICTVNNPATSNSLSFGLQPMPIITASGSDPLLCNEPGLINFNFIHVPDGMYDITYLGGVFEGVLISNGMASVQATPGLYENLAILVNGCVSTDDPDVLINKLDEPVVEGVSPVDPSCNNSNGQISITASGEEPLAYSINGDSGWQDSPLFEDLPPGDYFVLVRDALGCVTEYVLNPVSLINQGGASILPVEALHPSCNNSNGQISITASGEEPLAYSINGDSGWQDSPLFEDLPQGDYFVLVRDALGCVTEYVLNPVSLINQGGASILPVETLHPSCNNSNGQISITASGEEPLAYSINGDSGWQDSPLFEDLPQGDYFVLVRDALGCVTEYAQNPVTLINQGGASILPVETIHPSCNNSNGQISITASGEEPLAYSINGDSGWQDAPLFEDLPQGDYFVLVRDALGCVTEYTLNPVTLINQGGASILPVEALHPSCNNSNGEISITASGEEPLAYSINGDSGWQDSPLFEDLPQGDYFVLVRDALGCITEYALNPIKLIQQAGPVFMNVQWINASCGLNNGTVSIDTEGGTGQITYSIFGGTNWQSSPLFENLEAGNYYLMVTDMNGCSIDWNLNPLVIQSPEAVTITDIFTTDAGCHEDDGSIEIMTNNILSTVFFSIDNGLSWQDSGLFPELAAGFYTLRASDENQCESEFGSNPVEIKRQCSDLYVMPSAFSPNGDGLNDHFGPVWIGNKPIEFAFQVFNNWGEMLFITNKPEVMWNGSYQGTIVPAGTYAYRLYLRFESDRATGEGAEEIRGTVNLIR